MQYDPIKDRLGAVFCTRPLLQRLFYGLLQLFFLRNWHVRDALRALVNRPPGGRAFRMLDAGTGFGQFTWMMVREYDFVRVHAVDVKQDYLANLRLFLDRSPHGTRVTTAVDDLTRLEATGPFDLVLSVDVMEHIEQDRAVFEHFARVLRPGGIVIVNTPSDLGGSDVHADGESSFIGEHVRDGYSAADLTDKLRGAGLETESVTYTYGPAGSLAWRLLIRTPMRMLHAGFWTMPLLILYYLPVLPLGLLLNAMDAARPAPRGTGLLVVARLPD